MYEEQILLCFMVKSKDLLLRFFFDLSDCIIVISNNWLGLSCGVGFSAVLGVITLHQKKIPII